MSEFRVFIDDNEIFGIKSIDIKAKSDPIPWSSADGSTGIIAGMTEKTLHIQTDGEWAKWELNCLLGTNPEDNLSPFQKEQIHKRAREIVSKFKENQ